jgi:hypothetical protein
MAMPPGSLRRYFLKIRFFPQEAAGGCRFKHTTLFSNAPPIKRAHRISGTIVQ